MLTGTPGHSHSDPGSRTILTVGGDEGADGRELLHQGAPVQVEGMLVDLVQHHDDGRVLAEAPDEVQPVVGVRILVPWRPLRTSRYTLRWVRKNW